MADIDIINTYVPATPDLEASYVASVRRRLDSYAADAFPDVAHSPGTAIGDLVITPQSYIIAAIENGINNFASDLNLSNVANDIIYNCDFVKEYLKNFIPEDVKSLRSSGTVRIVFNTDSDFILDRSTQFRINGSIFTIYLPNYGPFVCFKHGTIIPAGVNGCVLKDTGSGSWFCDIPVLGDSGATSVIQGNSVEMSLTTKEMEEAIESITALHDFNDGTIEYTLPELAKLAQTTMYSASLNTRNGAIRFVNSMCPFVEGTYALTSRDREMLRDYKNEFGIASGCMDVYARTSAYEFTEVQQVRLVLNADKTAYEGDWEYVGQPYHLESITHPATNLEQLEHTITSTSDNGTGALASYTQHERLHISVVNLTDEGGDSIFSPEISDLGEEYTYFTVTYQTDPMLPALAHTVENSDCTPINTSIITRGFIPVIIEQFEVVYTRKPGVVPDLESAVDNIKRYLGSITYPDAYSDANVSAIMGEAGANYMKEINVHARVQWSIGHKVENLQGGIEDVLSTTIRNSSGLRVYYPSNTVAIAAGSMYACSPRNIRYYVLEDAITFKEIIE